MHKHFLIKSTAIIQIFSDKFTIPSIAIQIECLLYMDGIYRAVTSLGHNLSTNRFHSPVVDCWCCVNEVRGSIPSQGQRQTKDVKKMVPVVHFFSTQH